MLHSTWAISTGRDLSLALRALWSEAAYTGSLQTAESYSLCRTGTRPNQSPGSPAGLHASQAAPSCSDNLESLGFSLSLGNMERTYTTIKTHTNISYFTLATLATISDTHLNVTYTYFKFE